MSLIGALLSGLRRVAGAPFTVLALWIVNVLVALPATWVLASALERSLGASLVADEMVRGFDMGWYGEFRQEAKGLETTFRPSVAGATAIYDNLEAWLTGRLFRGFGGLVGLGLLYAAVWALLLGGVVRRLARPGRRLGPGQFLKFGGRFFPRFVRLAALSAVLYWLVYRLHARLMDWLAELTRDTTSERSVLVYSLVVFSVTAILLVAIHLCFSYAKVATVLENRRSMVFAALRGARFVALHPVRTIGAHLSVLAASAGLLALYAWLAPGAGPTGTLGMVAAFGLGQAFLLAKLALRLTALGSQIALFQSITGRTR